MFNTKCGCPYCKNGSEVRSRSAWMARKNKAGRSYSHGKGSQKPHSSKQVRRK